MSAYADTGFLCSLYSPDVHSSRAAARMQRQALPLGNLGTRSLDILHVASAVTLGVREFLPLDRRQGALAKAAGLRLPLRIDRDANP